MKHKLLLSLILLSALVFNVEPARAQQTYVTCLQYGEFNHSWWQLLSGVITDYGSLRSTSAAPNRVAARIIFDPPVRVSSVKWRQWFGQATTAGGATPLVQLKTSVELLKTYDPYVNASNDIFSPAKQYKVSTQPDTWVDQEVFFGLGDQYEVQTALDIYTTAGFYELSIPVEIANVQVCIFTQPGGGLTPTSEPVIPTATVQTYTPIPSNTPNPTITRTPTTPATATNTPTPSNTPNPGYTATNTLRPNATYTPTSSLTPGPSLTPFGTLPPSRTPTGAPTATRTPSPTITLLPTLTPGGSGGGGILIGTLPTSVPPVNGTVSKEFWATIPPPDKCAGPFSACGALPWPVPGFPTLQSPTPVPGQSILATATVLRSPSPAPAVTVTALTGTPNGTQVPSSLSTIEGNVQGQLSTMIANSTPSIAMNSTPVTVEGYVNTVQDSAALLVGYVKGIGLFTNSRLGDLILFLFMSVMFVILIKLLIFFLPLIVKFINFVVQIIQAIPFI